MPRKERTGVVVSDKMQKTRIALVIDKVSHSKYGKVQTRSKRYKFHDETNDSKAGDTVRIVESRPLSKDKFWNLKTVLKRNEEV